MEEVSSTTSEEVVIDNTASRLRMLAVCACVAALAVWFAASAPWFEMSTKNAAATQWAPTDPSCAAAGGIMVQDANMSMHCQVLAVSISADELASQSKDSIRVAGHSQGVAFKQLPTEMFGMPAVKFWGLLASLLLLLACVTQALTAAVFAPVAALIAWSSTSQLVSYAMDPSHGGQLNSPTWGVQLMKGALVVLAVGASGAAVQVIAVRRGIWAERRAQGLPATAFGKMIQTTLAGAAEMAAKASTAAEANK